MSKERTLYDYIVIGGGAAGCALASRLAQESDASVLLLEAGGNGRSSFITMPAGNGFIFGNPKYDWRLQSVPQPALNNRRIDFPRGKGLGGSTIMNGMIYIRGNPGDYDRWAATGFPGWSYQELLPYFKRAECAPHRDHRFHGHAGPLKLTPAANYNRVDKMFVEACRQAGLSWNDDFNGVSQTGVGVLDAMVHRGRRQSSARAYLFSSPLPSNLEVRIATHVTRVLFRGHRACGVEYRRDNHNERIECPGEIILCAGTFGSPHLLMLSGVGNAAELCKLGIEVIADLPGVGRNLKDHINVPVQYECLDARYTFARHQRIDRAAWLAANYFLFRRGPGAAPFWSAMAFHSPTGEAIPSLQVYFTPMVVTESNSRQNPALSAIGGSFLARAKQAKQGFQIDVNQMHPEAAGTVRLRSANPTQAPLIDPKFLQGDREKRDLIEGVRLARHIVSRPAFDEVRGKELSPGSHAVSDDDLLDRMRSIATTGHHPVGTCKMGPDSDREAVVDGSLAVKGLLNLRVVDASVFPDQITGNPNAPVVMIAEKAVDMILDRPPLPAEQFEHPSQQPEFAHE